MGNKFKVGDRVVLNKGAFVGMEGFIKGIKISSPIELVYDVVFDTVCHTIDISEMHLDKVETKRVQPKVKVRHDFLPTEVIFNHKKGKTTLMFNNKELGYNQTSITSKEDEFDLKIGFLVCYLKEIEGYKAREIIDWLYFGWGKEDILNGLLTSVSTPLVRIDILSYTQLCKLIGWDFNDELSLTLKDGTKHTIKVTHKGEL